MAMLKEITEEEKQRKRKIIARVREEMKRDEDRRKSDNGEPKTVVISELIKNCLIDTVEIRVNLKNFKDKEYQFNVKEYYSYITYEKASITKDGENWGHYRINLNNMRGYGTINNLTDFHACLLESIKNMTIIDPTQVNITRMDIAFDSDIMFSNSFKFLTFLFDMCLGKSKRSKGRCSVNFETMQANSLWLKDDYVEIEFYDKRLQSEGKHPHNTRMEFRFKKKKIGIELIDLERYINSLIDRLKNIDGTLLTVETNRTEGLLKLWEKEKGNLLSLSEFVRKYDQFIYTRTILKNIYEGAKMKGTFNNWIKSYKKSNKNNNDLELFTKNTIISTKAELLREIKKYKKDTTNL